MSLEITLTVTSTNHDDRTTISKTYSGGSSNPRMDGSVLRHRADVLTEHLAGQLDKLVNAPLSDPLAEEYLARRRR